MKWLKIFLVAGLSGALVLATVLLLLSSSDRHSPQEIAIHARRLNEAAAVQVPHSFLMNDQVREKNRSLLKRVEAGSVLNIEESAAYRALIQRTLFESQSFLGRFDSELTVLDDVSMEHQNNVAMRGIRGLHDHHDVSARRNYADLEAAIIDLESSEGPFDFARRIAAINLAHKSLADIISHMGVAVHSISVPYDPPEKPWRDVALSPVFESMMLAFKQAQFETVNGSAYRKNIDAAVDRYGALIAAVQERIWLGSSTWERRVAGRFLDYQTLAPQIDPDIPMRR